VLDSASYSLEAGLSNTVLQLFCLVCNWSVGRFVVVVPRAALLEQIFKSDTVARPRLSSFALVQAVVWLSEGSGE